MKKAQELRDSDMKSCFKKIMDCSKLDIIPENLLAKIRNCFINQNLHNTFLQLISKKIKEKEVSIRIKCWILLHMMLTGRTNNDSAGKIE